MCHIFHSEKSNLTFCVTENTRRWVQKEFFNDLPFPSNAAKSDVRAFLYNFFIWKDLWSMAIRSVKACKLIHNKPFPNLHMAAAFNQNR